MTKPKPGSNYTNTKKSGKLDAALKRTGWQPASNRCGTCGNDLVFDTDGMGNEISWCSICRTGERPRSRSSRNAIARGVLVPQGLVPALPSVRPGQLRCQRCARGIEGLKRFCSDCTADGMELLEAAS